jgi:hypothetical protein
MALVNDHSPGAYTVSVPCLTCGRMVRLCDALIDPNGPAFKAYYHVECRPKHTQIPQTCNRNGCTRCNNV